MKFYREQDVLEAARERVGFLFDEFDTVVVSFSGGKDSTVVLNLALEAAEARNRLPLKVLFLDQEGEWQATIDYIRSVFSDPRVEPIWMQIPIKIFNAASHSEQWLYCWDPAKRDVWMRPQETDSIKENKYGTDRFKDVLAAILKRDFPGKSCFLGGVRTEESPNRFVGLTTKPKYKHVTYAKKVSETQFVFYPIYDWSYSDVWKYIFSNKIPYCSLYDSMYQYGISVLHMRVSNLNHETALHSLMFLQEVEPKTWEALVERLGGINSIGHLKRTGLAVQDLPKAFSTWPEYRDYLVEHLTEPPATEIFKSAFVKNDSYFQGFDDNNRRYKAEISAVLHNDYHMTKLGNLFSAGLYLTHKALKRGSKRRLPQDDLRRYQEAVDRWNLKQR